MIKTMKFFSQSHYIVSLLSAYKKWRELTAVSTGPTIWKHVWKVHFLRWLIHRSFTKNTIDFCVQPISYCKRTGTDRSRLKYIMYWYWYRQQWRCWRSTEIFTWKCIIFTHSSMHQLYYITLTMKKSHGITAAQAINFRWLILADCIRNEPVIFNHPLCSSCTRTLIPWPVESLLWLR